MKNKYLLFLLPLFLCSLTARAIVHNVEVKNFSFAPATLLTVKVGDTIRWTWVSGNHTTTSLAIPAAAAAWDAPIRQNATTFLYKVTVPGIYNYVCTPHAPNMAGSFTAMVSGISGASAAAPVFALKGSVVTEEIIIDLDIVHSAQVNISLYNLVGRLVRTCSDARRETGTYQDNYPVGDLPKGLYLLAVKVGNQQTTRRVIVQ